MCLDGHLRDGAQLCDVPSPCWRPKRRLSHTRLTFVATRRPRLMSSRNATSSPLPGNGPMTWDSWKNPFATFVLNEAVMLLRAEPLHCAFHSLPSPEYALCPPEPPGCAESPADDTHAGQWLEQYVSPTGARSGECAGAAVRRHMQHCATWRDRRQAVGPVSGALSRFRAR